MIHVKKNCPICNTDKYSKKIYDENLPEKKNIDFSGRKNLDRYHYEMARCLKCSMLYATEIYSIEFTNKIYANSDFLYFNETQGLQKTYKNCLLKSQQFIDQKENFLDIGCGNGASMFLLSDKMKECVWLDITDKIALRILTD